MKIHGTTRDSRFFTFCFDLGMNRAVSMALGLAMILLTAASLRRADVAPVAVKSDVPVPTPSNLELAGTDPWYMYRRETPRPVKAAVRIACLYVGFLRDYGFMLDRCEDHRRRSWCGDGKQKFFGNQRRAILEPLDCDVFMTTWHVGGKGRYSTYHYDMNDVIRPEEVKAKYGDRMAVLHVQNYSVYDLIWRKMTTQIRNFTESYPVERGDQTLNKMWRGVPTYRMFFRSNDYSQSYKHWVVVKLADRYPVKYDLYYRLRTDLRTSRSFVAPFLRVSDSEFHFRMTNDPRVHVINSTSLHVHAPDYSDFGYMAVPDNIRFLTRVWSEQCLANGTAMTPEMAAGDMRPHHADYNRVVWFNVFQKKWAIDFGFTYLHVSRRYGETPSSLRRGHRK